MCWGSTIYSPYKASHRVGNIGKPLPSTYDIFEDRKVKIGFRRGGVSLIAGVPGSYKTAFALNLVKMWAEKDIYTQYFSIDSDEFTVVERLDGIITGYNMDEVERRLSADPHCFDQELYDTVGDKIMFEYQPGNWENLVWHVKSYEQKFGGYADVVVIDNLIDLPEGGVYAFDEMQAIIKNAGDLARKINAHCMILHHAKLEGEKKGNDDIPDWEKFGQPPADHEIQGKMTQFPTLALTIGAFGMDIRIASVKNRHGFQHRNAEVSHPFHVNYSMKVIER